MTRLALWVAFCMAMPLYAQAGNEPASPVGRKIEDFRLRDTHGREYALADFGDKPVLVVAFLGTECPLAKLYASRLQEMAGEYAPRNVAFVGIDSNRQDNLQKLASFGRRHGITFPLLLDVGNRVADQFAAVRTPEVFVLDQQRVIRYWGRIDDQFTVGVQRATVNRRDLATALDELLDGKPVSVAQTPAPGCFIGRVRPVAPTGSITYSKHIAPILQARCTECHRPGEIGPFPLLTYDDASSWAETIAEVVREERMPPWFASPHYGQFQDEARLTDDEKKLVADWVADGCPEGDPADLPPPRQYLDGWGMEKPDQVLYMSDTPEEIPATGVLDYKVFVVDPGWTEDKWLCGAEARPGNREVVHHILVFLQRPGKRYLPGLPGELVSAYAPGMKPTIASEGMGVHAPAGSKIAFQMHYTPNGSPQRDLSFVGFRFADEKDVEWKVDAGMAINLIFRIPPHADNHKVTASHTFRTDSILLGVNPHMHYRGKDFRYEAIYPDGRREILMDCPRYDFNWQLGYKFVEPVPMPAGTRLYCTAHFDNSVENLNNPDPNRLVTFGEQTWDEMMIGWFFSAEKRNP